MQGLGLLTLAAQLPSINDSECKATYVLAFCSPKLQVIMFFFSLYLVAFGQGGHKPCVQAFGADQFDGKHPEEHKARSSFFNWLHFTYSACILVNVPILNYIQENVSWVLGFGIPCLVMILALLIFLLGSKTYRFHSKGHEKSPFVRIGRVFVAALRNRRIALSNIAFKEEMRHVTPLQTSKQFK